MEALAKTQSIHTNCQLRNFFFNEHDLDACFIATNVPKQSAFNRVERTMSNLSKALDGVILPHYHLSAHLQRTIT